MSVKITSPIEGFTGRTVFGPLSVEFKDGVAETDQKIGSGLKTYLTNRGYKVQGVKVSTASGSLSFPDGEPAEAWKSDELKAYATAKGVDLGSATTKADIVKVLGEATEAVPDGSAEATADGEQGDGGEGGEPDGS